MVSRKELNYQVPDTISIPGQSHSNDDSSIKVDHNMDASSHSNRKVDVPEESETEDAIITNCCKDIKFDALSIDLKGKPKCFQSEHSWIQCIIDGYTSISQAWYNELNQHPENNVKYIPKPKYGQSVTNISKALELFHEHMVKKYAPKGDNPSIEEYRRAKYTLEDFFMVKACLNALTQILYGILH